MEGQEGPGLLSSTSLEAVGDFKRPVPPSLNLGKGLPIVAPYLRILGPMSTSQPPFPSGAEPGSWLAREGGRRHGGGRGRLQRGG